MELTQFQQAYNQSLKLLAIRKRTVRQLRTKLQEKGYDSSTVDSVVADLKEKKLISDEDYARAFIDEKLGSRPSGRLKLRRDLRMKGVPQELAEEALSVVSEDMEFESARRLAEQKAHFFRNEDPVKRKKKIFDFLIRRGFRKSVCRGVLKHIE